MRSCALVLVALCSIGCNREKVTAKGSRIVETFEVNTGHVALQSRFKAGISKGSRSGKWGLGASQPGVPRSVHIAELVIDNGSVKKTKYLCMEIWGSADFPDLEGDALLTRLENVAEASFRDREPELERCVREVDDFTLLVARCRVDPDSAFGAWKLFWIARDRGISSKFAPRSDTRSCREVIAGEIDDGRSATP